TASGGEYSLAASFAFGGKGGSGGNGNTASVANTGLVVTLGESADGVAAQSIGGGGGDGGAGDAKAKSTADTSLSTNIPMGGSGGSGGGGGNGGAGGSAQAALVTANNTAGSVILTYGADATGILAQSVGGGGGTAGKSASNLGTKTSTGDGGNSGVNAQTTLGDLAKDFNANPQGTINGYTNLSGAIGLANALLGNTTLPSAFGDDDPVDELDDTA